MDDDKNGRFENNLAEMLKELYGNKGEHPDKELLVDFKREVLDKEKHNETADHVAVCDECSMFLAKIEAFRKPRTAGEDEAGAAAAGRVPRAWTERIFPRAKTVSGRTPGSYMRRNLAAAMILLAFAAGFMIPTLLKKSGEQPGGGAYTQSDTADESRDTAPAAAGDADKVAEKKFVAIDKRVDANNFVHSLWDAKNGNPDVSSLVDFDRDGIAGEEKQAGNLPEGTGRELAGDLEKRIAGLKPIHGARRGDSSAPEEGYNREGGPPRDEAGEYIGMGDAASDKCDYDPAIQNYNRAIELDPENPVAYNNRGVAHYFKAEYDLAIEDFTTSAGMDDDVIPTANLAEAYIAKNDLENAMKYIEKTLDEFAADLSESPINYAAAFRIFRDAYNKTGAFPDPGTLLETAAKAVDEKDHARAVTYYYAYLLMKPLDADAAYNLAVGIANATGNTLSIPYFHRFVYLRNR